MKTAVKIFGVLAMPVMLAACGGGEKAPEAAPAESAAAPADPAAPADAAAPAAPAGAPTAESTDTLDGTTLASLTGDAAAGEKVFLQCKSCHAVEAGVNRIGPSMAGLIGRPSGQVAGYNYSAANKNAGITWSPEKMFQYLENPRRVVPGTKMAFAGLKKAQDRADVIAYLSTLK